MQPLAGMKVVRIVRGLFVASLIVGAGWEMMGEGGQDAEVQAQEPAPATRTDIPCFEKADNDTPLTREQALFLCRGARSLGPVECWNEGDDETTLSDLELIRLCRCARNETPVQCYTRADRETLLTDAQIIDMCRPIRADRLTPSCLPIRDL